MVVEKKNINNHTDSLLDLAETRGTSTIYGNEYQRLSLTIRSLTKMYKKEHKAQINSYN